MKIAVGADHAAFEEKRDVVRLLKSLKHSVKDFGTDSANSVDYPDYALQVGRAVARKKYQLGVLLCGSGIGMCIAANKVRGVRAALAWNADVARATREHNDSNVLCLSGRFMTKAQIHAILKAWLATPFSQGERHKRRLGKIAGMEKIYGRR
jgi:ribose 5-phosphate isomerase B